MPTIAAARLSWVAAEWRVEVDHVEETATSTLGFGTWRDLPVVLKVVHEGSDEWLAGEIAATFGGQGMAKVYRHAPGASLTERLLPGTPLVDVVTNDDDEATLAITGVIDAMCAAKTKVNPHAAMNASARTAESFATSFDRGLAADARSIRSIPREMVIQAATRYRQLCATQKVVRLLHGDLQHYNVLRDERRGWLAIDPKGVYAELEFEIGAMLRNPVERVELLADPAVIERRTELVSNRLGLDPVRILDWAYAQGVLSALWSIEDGEDLTESHAGLAVARTIATML